MVLRTATKGTHSGKQFYGCSRYPRCKGIRNQAPESQASVPRPSQSPSIPVHEQDPFMVSAKASAEPSKVKTPLSEIQKREIAKLRDRLLNVSSRNRSIRLNRLDKKSAFDLSSLNEFDPKLVNELIEHCLTQDADIPLLPKKDHDNEEAWDKLSENLTHLFRNVTELYKEKGIRDLYIGFPFISGQPSGAETIIQAPVFLIPVQLEKTFPKKGMPIWTIKPSSDQKVFFNKTLFYALAKLCNLTVNQAIFDEEVPTELYGNQNFVEWTHALLQNYGVISKIHEEALDQEFDRVQEFAVSNETSEPFRGGLKICQNAVLGHFPQSNSSIQKDYEAFLNMSQEDIEGISCFLSEENIAEDQEYDETSIAGAFDFSENESEVHGETIDSRDEKDNFFLLASDSSQDKIILELSKPSTDGLVVWGPPGTGKSQTIVNVIADCIAKGKTVLLVSQKRAALDVVYERLASRQMHSVAAVVHDSKEDRKDLYKKISSICAQNEAGHAQPVDPTPEITAISNTLKEVGAAYNDLTFGRKSGFLMQELAAYKGPYIESLSPIWLQAKIEAVEQVAQTLSSFQQLPRPAMSKRISDVRKDFGLLDPSVRQTAFDTLRKLKTDPEILRAVEVAIIQSSVASSIAVGLEEFKSATETLRSSLGFKKFLTSSYWRASKIVKTELKRSINVRKTFTTQLRKALEPFFSAALTKEIDLVINLDLSLEALSEAFPICTDYFDTFKALDNFRLKLPPDVIALESNLLSLAETDRLLNWGRTFKCSVFDVWTKDLERRHPVLSAIKSGQIDTLRSRLKVLLDQKSDYSVFLLQRRLKLSLGTEPGKQFSRAISSEVDKKRNVSSVRKLNEKFVDEAHFKSMLPVWLVSPETVSDVFPLKKGMFDVVIFDEASQCTVENGLPAIFRGKQIIIAGDEKQLPPSKMFETSIEEETDENAFASIEPSLLTLAKKTLRYKAMMLEWHYRSKHQELVTFSNEVFYGGRMKIAPNVVPFVKGNKPAIEWHSVNGFWTDRTNPQEADQVLHLIESHLSKADAPSVGVITFNVNQKNLILDLIDTRTQTDADFGAMMEANRKLPLDEQLFVKNIENVQGDERDVIIFSVAYAPAHPGARVQQHFGLLNKPGGENRLNVAVTRAISQIQIVSSINPETDLNTSTSAHAGPKIFHKYLCFAKAVAEENFDRLDSILAELNPNLSTRPETGHLQFDSPFEEDVYNELTLYGYEVHSQVGQSGFRIDLAVVDPKDPSRYLLGIECDGAMYHSSVSVRERDVFRQRFLESRGWKIHRIWSPSWRENRRRELQKIRILVEELNVKKVLSAASD
jgi:very-short-patch-repair endonuclease